MCVHSVPSYQNHNPRLASQTICQDTHTQIHKHTHTHTEEVIQINNSNNHLLVSKTGPDCNYPFSKSSRHPKPRHDDTHLYSQHWGGRSRMSLWVQSQPGLHSKFQIIQSYTVSVLPDSPLSFSFSLSLCLHTHTHTHTHTQNTQTHTETDRQTHRQTDRHTHTHTQNIQLNPQPGKKSNLSYSEANHLAAEPHFSPLHRPK